MARTLATNRRLIQTTPYSLDFLGGTNITNNVLQIGSSTNLDLTTTSFALFGRMYFKALNTVATRMYLWSYGATRGIFGLPGSTNVGKFGIDNGVGITPFSTIAEVGRWYSFVLNYDKDTNNWNLYLNGELDATTVNLAPASSTVPHYFGHHYTTTNWGFVGNFCGLYLLKRVCTATEAAEWYTQGKLPTSDSYQYKIDMEEGTGNPVDSGPNVYATTKGSSISWSSTFVPYVERSLATSRTLATSRVLI